MRLSKSSTRASTDCDGSVEMTATGVSLIAAVGSEVVTGAGGCAPHDVRINERRKRKERIRFIISVFRTSGWLSSPKRSLRGRIETTNKQKTFVTKLLMITC